MRGVHEQSDWQLPRLATHLGAGIVAAIINAALGEIVLLILLRLVYRRPSWGFWLLPIRGASAHYAAREKIVADLAGRDRCDCAHWRESGTDILHLNPVGS
jgi:hypothetical protein